MENSSPSPTSVSVTQEAIKAFASLYSPRTGTHCEVQPWPGGGEESHDADAVLIIRKNRTRLRVLLEATEVFQGPVARFGSEAERFLRSLRALEQDVLRLVPSDCSVTIYWRGAARRMLDRPTRDRAKRQVTRAVLQAVTDQCHAARLSGSAVVVDDEVYSALRPWVRTIATLRSTVPEVTFRYPLPTTSGTTQYSDIPLSTVGVGPADVDAAIFNKLTALPAYRQRAKVHQADQVWLLVVASGQSAASTLSPLTFVGKIPGALSSLRIKPTFDAIYLLARGSWARAEDPLGPGDEWLFVPMSGHAGLSRDGRS